ncbi:MAG: ABC transporter permease, partial [Saprospiraceae bacterium]|nr:ABC transporter permease [Saprospiraceae bacterium]
MNLLKLSWRNITYKPLNMALSLILFALGIGLITFLLLVNDQLKENFDKNLAEIDLVIGAKGSPLQMILCNMYHIDNPTGNISVKDARPFLSPRNPLIKSAVPLSLGDSHKGFRIVGTNHKFLELYKAEISEGELFENDYDVNIGVTVAKDLGLSIGSKFESTHGFMDDEDMGHDHGQAFVVKGIFAQSGTVVDHLIVTNTPSIWHVHHSENDGSKNDDVTSQDNHSGHDHSHHDHSVSNFNLLDHPEEEITSILVQFKNNKNFQALSLPRNINKNTPLQAATPAIEMNRLYDLIGVGVDTIRQLALLIALVSGISIFISLYNALRDRKYELALMRVNGASPFKLFALILLEGLILAVIGSLIGMAIGHFALGLFGDMASERYNYSFTVFKFLKAEIWLFVASLVIGTIAA